MAKIVKIDDAPEGAIELTYPGGSFKVDGRGHKTDDPAALEAAASFPEYFAIEDEDGADEAAVKREAERIEKVRRDAEEAKAKRASKKPSEPAPENSVPAPGIETPEDDN